MKATHERSVLDRLQSDDLAASLLFDIPCMGRITNVWRLGSAVLVCCSHGSIPVEVCTGRWRGSGLSFYFAGKDADPIQLYHSSEAHADIQFWLEGNALHVELATFLYDERRFAPFAELVFSVKGNSHKRAVIMLMGGSPDQTDRIPSILADLKQCDPSSDLSGTLVGLLFKIGLCAPAQVLSVFEEVCEVAFPGGEGALGMMMRSELELVLEATAVG